MLFQQSDHVFHREDIFKGQNLFVVPKKMDYLWLNKYVYGFYRKEINTCGNVNFSILCLFENQENYYSLPLRNTHALYVIRTYTFVDMCLIFSCSRCALLLMDHYIFCLGLHYYQSWAGEVTAVRIYR